MPSLTRLFDAVAERSQSSRRGRGDFRAAEIDLLEPRTMLSAVTVSAAEQYMIELVNRARQDPSAEAARLGVGLNENRESGDEAIASGSRQVLASNQALVDAAEAHSQDMLQNNYFNHYGQNGSTPTSRAQSNGYDGVSGENLAWFGSTGPIDTGAEAIDSLHLQLWTSFGHRSGMLETDIRTRETGVGFETGPFTRPNRQGVPTTYNAAMVGQLFGKTNANRVYITGVAYEDAASGAGNDDFYSIGEGLTAGRVVATHTQTGEELVGELNSAGGYNVLIDQPGSYIVRLEAGASSYTLSSPITVGNLNQKVDFDLSELPADPPPAADIRGVIGRVDANGAWWHSRMVDGSFETVGLGRMSSAVDAQAVLRGDFDGDGSEDALAVTERGDVVVALFGQSVLLGETALAEATWGGVSATSRWSDFRTGDFNGDGLDDIAGRNGDGYWAIGISDGSSFDFGSGTRGRWSRTADWVDVRVGDFNGDGRDELAGRNASAGSWWVSQTRSETDHSLVTQQAVRWSRAVNWTNVTVGDFNDDGRDDLLGLVDGSNSFWVSEGAADGSMTTHNYGRLSTSRVWSTVFVGNFSGSDAPDIAVRDLGNGRWTVGQFDGSGFSFSRPGQWNAGTTVWTDVVVADLDGNGYDELVGRTSSGAWWASYNDGQTLTATFVGRWTTRVDWVDVTSVTLSAPAGSATGSAPGGTLSWNDEDLDKAATDAFFASDASLRATRAEST